MEVVVMVGVGGFRGVVGVGGEGGGGGGGGPKLSTCRGGNKWRLPCRVHLFNARGGARLFSSLPPTTGAAAGKFG